MKTDNVSNKVPTKYNLLAGSKTCRDNPSMPSIRKSVHRQNNINKKKHIIVKPIQSSLHSESNTAILRDEITLGYIYSETKIKSDIE